jgi:PAS domain S-box-containing protein
MPQENKFTVLILTPVPKFGQSLVKILNDEARVLLMSETIEEAERYCQTHRVRLIVLDAQIVHSSEELTLTSQRLLTASPGNVPHLLTLLPTLDEATVKSALDAGATDIMSRPIIPSLLQKRVQWLLQSVRTADLHHALMQSEAQVRTIITNASMILFAYNADGILTFVDGRGLAEMGRTKEDFLGRSILSLDNQQIVEDARYVLSSGQTHTSTVQVGNRYFESWYNPLLDENGRVITVIGVSTEVTQREQADYDLQQSLNFYLTFFEDFPVPVWRVGRNANLNYVNQSWLEFTGHTHEQAVSQGWLAVIHPDDRQLWRDEYIEHFRRRKAFEIECRMMRQDGEVRHMINLGRPFYELDGKFGGFIGLVYDITDRKEAEARVIELNLERERVQMLQEFITTVSHDLKTPLSSIILYANLLRQTNTAAQRYQYSMIVEDQSKRLKQLLDNMLAVSRLDEEIRTLTFQLVNIGKLLQEIAQFYSVAVTSAGLEYKVEIDPNLPRLLANESELRRSIGNLIDNAIKYTDNGSVSFRSYASGQFVMIEVQDTGIGIAEEDLPHIFERFFRADRSRSMRAGTGLGLTIVRKIIEAHGGMIECISAPNKGTTIRVSLPMLGKLVDRGRPENN